MKKAAVVLKAQMKAEHLANVKPEEPGKGSPLSLLRDRHSFYVAINNPPDNKVQAGTMMSNLMPNTGLRALPVNGMLYSFNGKGELNWYNEAPNQMLVLDEFRELPMVLLTSRYNKWLNGVPGQIQVAVDILIYDKQTGKRIYFKEDTTQGIQQFHSLVVKAQAGKVELRSYNLSLVFNLFGRADADKPKEGGKTPGTTGLKGSETSDPQFPPPPRFRGGLKKLGVAPAFRPQLAQPLILTK